jgi:hypothetical protein
MYSRILSLLCSDDMAHRVATHSDLDVKTHREGAPMKLDVNGPMPNITPAQLVAVAGAIIAMVVAFGVPISAGEREAITNLATVVFPVVIAADALIRHGRSRALLSEPRPVPDDTPAGPASIQDGKDTLVLAPQNGNGNGNGIGVGQPSVVPAGQG